MSVWVKALVLRPVLVEKQQLLFKFNTDTKLPSLTSLLFDCCLLNSTATIFLKISFSPSVQYKPHSRFWHFAFLCKFMSQQLSQAVGVWMGNLDWWHLSELSITSPLTVKSTAKDGAHLMHFGAEITSSEDKYCLQQAYRTLLLFPSIYCPWKFYIIPGDPLRPTTKYLGASPALGRYYTPPERRLRLWAAELVRLILTS